MFSLIPVLFLDYVLVFYVDIRWIRSTGHMFCLLLIYLIQELVQFLINQQQAPRKFILSSRWPYLAAFSAKYLGFLILACSYAADEFYGRGVSIVIFVVGGLLMLGSWLCFEFWKDYPLEEK